MEMDRVNRDNLSFGGLLLKAHRHLRTVSHTQTEDRPCRPGINSLVHDTTVLMKVLLRQIVEYLVRKTTFSRLPTPIISLFLHLVQVEIGGGGVGENRLTHFRTLGRIVHVTQEEVKILKIITTQKCYKTLGNIALLCQFKYLKPIIPTWDVMSGFNINFHKEVREILLSFQIWFRNTFKQAASIFCDKSET
ncbi:uncharacterized protein LOC133192260 [Saccostrea echinata]|uniref:uncharacterized protein LOC133192260 n=1 Tax=Saccostrea echinata TaxID=191078 RepID=UPI002A808DF0|nr:uncharacterized protein LOC133192260 [Saccostrea echinata]